MFKCGEFFLEKQNKTKQNKKKQRKKWLKKGITGMKILV